MHKLVVFLLMAVTLFAEDGFVYVTIDQDAVANTRSALGQNMRFVSSHNGISVLRVHQDSLNDIAEMMHEKHRRCSGYILHEDMTSALDSARSAEVWKRQTRTRDSGLEVSNNPAIKNLARQVELAEVEKIMRQLEAFPNRYYTSRQGVAAAQFIASTWRQMAEGVAYASVTTIAHKGYPQPSVVLTLEGKTSPDSIYIIGGHLDSISSAGHQDSMKAPGSDDNASGVASFMEASRIMLKNRIQPASTVQFMAYAAEEVGLRGSQSIAREYKEKKEQVMAVMQLDMTNYAGSDKEIWIYEDYTNQSLNAYIEKLIKAYLPYSVDKSSCGYACSDHASWTMNGFASTYPSEARMGEDNPHIHTTKDTLATSGGTGKHAAKFAELALVFALDAAGL